MTVDNAAFLHSGQASLDNQDESSDIDTDIAVPDIAIKNDAMINSISKVAHKHGLKSSHRMPSRSHQQI